MAIDESLRVHPFRVFKFIGDSVTEIAPNKLPFNSINLLFEIFPVFNCVFDFLNFLFGADSGVDVGHQEG